MKADDYDYVPLPGEEAVCQHGTKGKVTEITTDSFDRVLWKGHRAGDPSRDWQTKRPEKPESVGGITL